MQQINVKKFKIRHDWAIKVIHRELSKKFKFDFTSNAQTRIRPGNGDTKFPGILIYKQIN